MAMPADGCCDLEHFAMKLIKISGPHWSGRNLVYYFVGGFGQILCCFGSGLRNAANTEFTDSSAIRPLKFTNSIYRNSPRSDELCMTNKLVVFEIAEKSF